MLLALACFALVCAAVPALLFLQNLPLYRRAPAPRTGGDLPCVSLLIPARDEALNIAAALEAALANRGADFEIIVLDDHSSDGTAAIVRDVTKRDPRVRLEHAPELPAGWCGKLHACHILAGHARHPLLVFADADTRLAPDALARFAAFMEASGCDLASGVPRQLTGTMLEKLLVPLIHFVLLGFLPLSRMRGSTDPAFGVGCGQLFLARRAAYEKCGGHAAVGANIHDGLALPRAFRRAGFRTDLFDATDTISCRMYATAAQVWDGFAKNATEAMAAPRLIVPATLVLLGGQVLPWVLLGTRAGWLSGMALVLSLLPRVLAAQRFQQGWLGVALHPVSIVLLVAIQWHAFFRKRLGRASIWKGRKVASTLAQPH